MADTGQLPVVHAHTQGNPECVTSLPVALILVLLYYILYYPIVRKKRGEKPAMHRTYFRSLSVKASFGHVTSDFWAIPIYYSLTVLWELEYCVQLGVSSTITDTFVGIRVSLSFIKKNNPYFADSWYVFAILYISDRFERNYVSLTADIFVIFCISVTALREIMYLWQLCERSNTTNSFIWRAWRYQHLRRFENTKGVIRIRISKKNIQHNGQKKKYKMTNNDLQNIHIKLKIE
jgi:hypothetical protein